MSSQASAPKWKDFYTNIFSHVDDFTIVTKSLTEDFAESHLKKRVKKGGSLPSITIYIGASWDNFSRRKSSSRKFCSKWEAKVRKHTIKVSGN